MGKGCNTVQKTDKKMIAGNITKIQKKCNRLQVDLNEGIQQI